MTICHIFTYTKTHRHTHIRHLHTISPIHMTAIITQFLFLVFFYYHFIAAADVAAFVKRWTVCLWVLMRNVEHFMGDKYRLKKQKKKNKKYMCVYLSRCDSHGWHVRLTWCEIYVGGAIFFGIIIIDR